MRERYGSWFVRWRPEGFDIQGADRLSFDFSRLVLPVEIVLDPEPPAAAHSILRLAPRTFVPVLHGASERDLRRFKTAVSGEVLLMIRRSPSGCFDCADDAGTMAISWDGQPCPGCREAYCRNPRCLRRLGSSSDRCGRCGTMNGRPVLQGAAQVRTEREPCAWES